MKEVLTHPSLKHCLAKLQIRSPSQQLKLWGEQKAKHQRTTSIIRSLGKPSVTACQAKKIDTVGLTYAGLMKISLSAEGEGGFSRALKAKGINSKALQAKLWKLLRSSKASFVKLEAAQHARARRSQTISLN